MEVVKLRSLKKRSQSDRSIKVVHELYLVQGVCIDFIGDSKCHKLCQPHRFLVLCLPKLSFSLWYFSTEWSSRKFMGRPSLLLYEELHCSHYTLLRHLLQHLLVWYCLYGNRLVPHANNGHVLHARQLLSWLILRQRTNLYLEMDEHGHVHRIHPFCHYVRLHAGTFIRAHRDMYHNIGSAPEVRQWFLQVRGQSLVNQ